MHAEPGTASVIGSPSRRSFLQGASFLGLTAAGLPALAAPTVAGLRRALAPGLPALNGTNHWVNHLPTISESGTRMAFAAGTATNQAVYVGPVLAQDGAPSLLVPESGDEVCLIEALAFSRSGSHVAFVRRSMNTTQKFGRVTLEEVDVATGVIRELVELLRVSATKVEGPGQATSLAYSADDSSVLFPLDGHGLMSVSRSTKQLATFNEDGSSVAALSRDSDGSLAYVSQEEASGSKTYWLTHVSPSSLASTSKQAIAIQPCIGDLAHVALLGDQIAYLRESDAGGSEIAVLNTASGDTRVVWGGDPDALLLPGAFVSSSGLAVTEVYSEASKTGEMGGPEAARAALLHLAI